MKLTLVLVSYRQERFIAEALEGILSQTLEDAEIILSDDSSPDATFDIMQDVVGRYDGPLTLRLRRNAQNLGLAEHLNVVMREARGDLISLCAGDDIALPDRAALSLGYFRQKRALSALSLRPKIINDTGQVIGEGPIVPDAPLTFPGYFKGRQAHPNGASRTYRRDVMSAFGPLSPDCPSEDSTLLLRSMILGEVREFADIGLMYRKHDTNLSNRDSLRRMNVSAIQAQMRLDLETASSIGLIDASTRKAYEECVDAYWTRRHIAATAQDDGPWATLPALLFAPQLSWEDRFRLGRRLIRSHRAKRTRS